MGQRPDVFECRLRTLMPVVYNYPAPRSLETTYGTPKLQTSDSRVKEFGTENDAVSIFLKWTTVDPAI